MDKSEFGYELKKILEKESDIVKISGCVYKIYSNDPRVFDRSMRFILHALFSMEDDPQFEYTIDELYLIAEKLINNEEDPIGQIHAVKGLINIENNSLM